ncbi:BFD domain protein (2Fe-2S)-binding domain protein [Zymomonas mobilis subsp. mobilis ZM4 = ATCC 31821]|uniref:Bacterioferritin-associated ferredoxin n=1 Tax=Zymomonas mobilis subsp. mobilis (strain ATCC 31821 / ZM4 / CP4) TaxID=264203 RepID=D2N0X1_ZYMMO|nr:MULTISPECIES: (2Fe-2S)-binding protein [Zymomonas]ACV76311.1 BFD domain protein (2Fe-2S)-binding domain protein [Zymomonas mobilis subsp. mobilis NCIMB 11163]ADB28973.1 BFD domain protein (2Fe-2S)-binding domain protein [Zymomonas mobilis subsp. mobilis ZM4 = ATCC 31821]AHB10988.1 bacterioferritin-associated ferredoxin [Zymomonas mobilis subsp. mobilis str. CP4 = NRRL B-14023]AHJ71303.1 BFD domain-containing protein (2Fe-2S)-binding domain-containing protein [Zymomonas mobilis subsp. mobilis
MIICHCNTVSDQAIKAAVRQGAVTPGQAYKKIGVKFCCGKCGKCVQKVIAEAQEETV